MTQILFVLIMAVLSRMSGGGLGAQHLDREFKLWKWKIKFAWLPEALFAVPFGWVGAISAAAAFGGEPSLWVGLGFWVWSFMWMETGHDVVLQWGDNPAAAQGERTQTLSPLVNLIADKMGLTRGDRNYCRLFMAVKGFLLGFPAGGVPLAIMWPIGYEIGWRLRGRVRFDPHAAAELVSGAGAGVAILIAVYAL